MFTDDDLKRLKEQLPRGKWTQHLTQDSLEALIARLEAAEKGIENALISAKMQAESPDNLIDFGGERAEMEEALMRNFQPWRKAAGKESK